MVSSNKTIARRESCVNLLKEFTPLRNISTNIPRAQLEHYAEMQVLSMISSNTVERQIRGDFVLRCNISSERARADEICASSESARALVALLTALVHLLAVCCVWMFPPPPPPPPPPLIATAASPQTPTPIATAASPQTPTSTTPPTPTPLPSPHFPPPDHHHSNH